MHASPDRLATFLMFLHQALHEQKPLKLQNCVIRSEFLQLLRGEKLHAFQGLLDTSPHASHLDAETVHKFHAEIVYRELVCVPRTLAILRPLLQTHYPTDALTQVLDRLVAVFEADTGWIGQEAAWLAELRQLREAGSCFEDVLVRILNAFAPEPGQNKASTHVVFVRGQEPHDSLADSYLPLAIVRKIATVGEPAGDRIFAAASGLGAEFETTARAVQNELRSHHLLAHYLQYQFSDRLLYWDEFYGEGRSAGLAFAYVALAYTNPVYRQLSSYVACLGTYEDEIVLPRVERLAEKVTAAKASGIRVLIVPEASRADEHVDWQGCDVITYRSGPLGEVLDSMAQQMADLADMDMQARAATGGALTVAREHGRLVTGGRERKLTTPAPAPVAQTGMLKWADLAGRPDITVLVVPTAWVLYVAVVCEILFMASPFALYYYSAYGPWLNWFHQSPWTAWLTSFFLPHFSYTSSPLLNSAHELGGVLVSLGIAVFVVAFVHLYGVKIWRRDVASGGLYAVLRHPQYLGLAITGLGTLLLWPRFLVLMMYITMLFLYGALARWEEARLTLTFGARYRAYHERTGGRFIHRLLRPLPRLVPPSGRQRLRAVLALYVVILGMAIMLGYWCRDYTLAHLSSLYTNQMAVLSPAVLSETELRSALQVAMTEDEVQDKLQVVGRTAKLLVYVIPVEWELPDLPLELAPKSRRDRRGHYTPFDFDRRLYKVLFTKVRTHARAPKGKTIVTTAYGRDSIIVARVNTETAQVTRIDIPPPYVWWGDISTPLF